MNIGMTKAIASQAAKDEIAKGGLVIDNVARTGVQEVKSQLDETKSGLTSKTDKAETAMLQNSISTLQTSINGITSTPTIVTQEEIILARLGRGSLSDINNQISNNLLRIQNNIFDYIYLNGNEYENKTGLWKEGFFEGEKLLTKNSDSLKIYSKGTASIVGNFTSETTKKVNLTSVKAIYVDWEQKKTDGRVRSIIGYDSLPNRVYTLEQNLAISGKFDRRITTMDVSSVTGEKYIKLSASSAGYNVESEVIIYGIYFELLNTVQEEIISVKNNINTTKNDLIKEINLSKSELASLTYNYGNNIGNIVKGFDSSNNIEKNVIFNSDHILLYAKGSVLDISVVTESKINFSQYDELEITLDNTSTTPVSSKMNICISDNKISHRLDGSVFNVDGNISKQTYKIDISTLDGEKYIRIHTGTNGGGANVSNTMRIYSVILKKSAANVLKLIDDLKNSNINVELPNYWNTKVNNSINKIVDLKRKCGNLLSNSIFITDIHWRNNAHNSGKLIEKIMSDCEINYLINGGDTNTGEGKESYDKIVFDLTNGCNLLKNNEKRYIINAIGNHDRAYDDTSNSGYYLKNIPQNELFYLTNSQFYFNDNIDICEDGTAMYFDDKVAKIRYLILNTSDFPYEVDSNGLVLNKYNPMTQGFCVRQKQLDFVINKGLQVESGYSIMLYSHAVICSKMTTPFINKDILYGILKAFNTSSSYSGSSLSNIDEKLKVNINCNFSTNTSKIICWTGGHWHEDFSELDINLNTTVVMRDADGLPTNGASLVGTDNEHCFDIISVNKFENKIIFTRVGRGNDLIINY